MDARRAIREVIEAIPSLFGTTRTKTIGAEGETETVVYTQAQVADLIASVLPDALKAKGHMVIALPEVESYESGRRYVRVPITAQPWSDGTVPISPHGDAVAIRNVPDKLPMQDVPALAAALMAAYCTWRPPRRR
ncbi:hypothetical protein [Mycobacteroides abscessus]|uniref:hypothetical protein n=1 Tax=Mycobacteroides abscessus TaxID=36809 RepID=UPI0009298CEC|nr:hypothetical protein [Mycobacteroides abscessus]SIM96664.1 Uncharacterised protein [Mycobacteroides abscessus subsp. abscessus]